MLQTFTCPLHVYVIRDPSWKHLLQPRYERSTTYMAHCVHWKILSTLAKRLKTDSVLGGCHYNERGTGYLILNFKILLRA